MGIEIVHDEVQLRRRRSRSKKEGQETREIVFGSRLVELPSYNQGMGAVTLILEFAALDPFRGHWLRPRYTLKYLYSYHFVNRDRLDSRCRPLRSQTVRLADVVEFLRELEIWFGVQPAATAMRFDVS